MSDNEELDKKIDIILRQTDYSYDIAREKLKAHNFNEILVIKEYLVGNRKEFVPTKKITSINQEIYNQIRTHLNKPNNSDKYLSYK